MKNKTGKRGLLKKTMNKTRKLVQKMGSPSRCHQFCKTDYMVEMDKVFKRASGNRFVKETSAERDYRLNVCKKTFCNEKCDGYDFNGDKQKQGIFKRKIKDGFQTSYNKQRIDMLKKRGALSGCVDVTDYNVFHK